MIQILFKIFLISVYVYITYIEWGYNVLYRNVQWLKEDGWKRVNIVEDVETFKSFHLTQRY